MKKKVISILLAIVMLFGIIPFGAISAFAEEKTDNQYVVRSWDGTKVTEQFVDIPSATTVTSTATVWENGWYVADGTVDISSVRVGGNVNLILKGGCKLTVGGITVTGSDSLTIYAQKGGAGELISKASANNYAGIGGGSKDDGGIIAIHGGKITATGGNMAAGIGGGFQGACGTVTIYGGEVTATGGFNGAGIGTGSAPRNNGGSIAIYGGKVTVSTSDNSAMGDQRPRAIGGGFNGSVGTITIGSIMEVSDGSGNIVTAPSGEQTWADVLTGICYTFCLPVVEYLVADGIPAKCDTYTPVTKDTKTWTSGYYVVNEDVEISGDIRISGVVNLILTDGKTLTVDGSMLSDSDLSIYAQSNGEKMGKLNSNGVIQSSGKGSIYIYGGSVTTTNYILGNGGVSIIGGVVTANGHAYGIASNGDIIIKSKVTATGEDSAIWSTGNITLYGEVSATGGRYGICSKGITTIYGKVSATGENAGIFAERECWIVYGSVTAVGGEFGVECVTKGIRIYESGNTTISGNVRAIKGNGHEIETVEVYNRANERVLNPNETLWDKVLTDTYYRFVTEGSVVPYRYYDIESGEFKDDVYFGCKVIDEYTTEWEIPENNDEKWYAVKGEPVINGDVSVSGEVHLILTDESTLTVNGSITGENAQLYLYAQSTGNNTGKLECKGKDGKDGNQLQGSDIAENGNPAIHVKELTVDGSAIMAIGGNGGIGRTSRNYAGDSGANGGDAVISDKITLNAATVTAIGGTGGRGGGGTSSIGKGGIGGDAIKVKEVTINGGTVTATGGTGGITSGRDGNAVGGIAVSFEETFEVNGGEITLNGGNGGEGELNNGERGSIGNYAVSGGKLIINSGKLSATGGTGGNGGNGGSDPRGPHDGWGGTAGNGGIAIGVESLVLNSGTITATGGMGGNGGIARNLDKNSDYSGGTGGDGAIAVSCQTELTVKDGILTANGGNGGAGGKTINDVYAPSGAVGASVSLNKDCVIEGVVTVKTNEGDEYSPLPSSESISDYRFARITNTQHTHDFKGDYVDNSDGTHSRKCTVCGELSTPENHTYKDGVCNKCGSKIITVKDTAIIKDGYIYGLAPKLTSLTDYIDVAEGYELEYSTDTIGTGTTVNVVRNGEVVDAYTTVLFGDVNNDGIYDGMDAVTVSMIATEMLTRQQVGEAVYMAADCNHDGVTDSKDVELLEEAGLLLASVNQSKSQGELQTDSAYVEYLNLIDQNPVNEEAEPEQTPSALDKLIAFIADIYAFLNNLINFIKTIFA